MNRRGCFHGGLRTPVAGPLLLLILLASSCSLSSPRLLKHAPVAIEVPTRPGSAAWSPDSRRMVAIAENRVCIVDPSDSDSRSCTELPGAEYLEWSPAETILIAVQGGEAPGIHVLDPDTLSLERVHETGAARAVRWIQPPRSFSVLEFKLDRRRIGAFATFRQVFVRDKKTSDAATTHCTYPPSVPEEGMLQGWLHSPVRPVFDEVVRQRYQKPPVFPPFTALSTFDPYTGQMSDWGRVEGPGFSLPVAWSADGLRLAHPDENGRLKVRVLARPADTAVVVGEGRGVFPSWNPTGDAIYFGGAIVDDGGGIIDRLTEDSASIGLWSPDGTRLALLSDGKLRVYDGWGATVVREDAADQAARLGMRDRLRLLKELYVDRLIDLEEYGRRKERLFTGGTP